MACHIGRVSGDHLDLQKLESIGKSCLQWDTKSMEKQSDKFNCSTLIGKHQESTSSNWKSPTTNLGYKIQSGFRSFKNNPVEVAPAFVLLYIYTHSHLAFFCQTLAKTHTTGLNTAKLISNCRTVTTSVFITPCNDGSIFQNRRKGPRCGLNLQHTFELIFNCRTVTA